MLSLFGAKKYTLIEAVEKQDFNLVKKLIENGANINEQNKDENTALMLAVMVNSNSTNNFNLSNQHEIIKYLLDKGANIFHKNKYNYNILEIMRGKSHYDDIVKIFNKHSNDVQKPNDISNITSEKVKEENLIKNTNTYKFGASLLYLAILDQNIDKIKMLLNNGADIDLENTKDIPYDDTKLDWLDDRNKTPLYASVKVGNIEIVNLLINHNADINTLLSLSINKNNFEISELLLHKGANPNKNFANSYSKDFPLNTACRNQNLKLVKLLIENGADANFVRDDGQTALFEAISATKANKEIIRFLIANGADIYKEDNNGISPLSFAESNKTSLVKILVENQKIELSENQDTLKVTNYENLLEKIVLQNKVINMLKDEIKAIKNSDTNNHTKVDYQLSINSLKEVISSQAIEIKTFQEKLIEQEQNTKKSIDDLIHKINILEEMFDKQNIVDNKLSVIQEETDKKIQELLSKIELLEKKSEVDNKKTVIPAFTTPSIKETSLIKNDGVVVRRDSLDDF